MPLPKPNKGENRSDFIRRCMSDPVMKREYKQQKQRLAVCESQFDRRDKMQASNIEGFDLWLGDFRSYQAWANLPAPDAVDPDLIRAFMDEGEENDEFQGYGYMTQLIGHTAIIRISGPLIPKSSWISQLFGMTGYDEIRNALAAASQHPDVKAIILDIDSPGGAVSGVDEAAGAIRHVDRNIMPVHALTTGAMASAAYWLGSSAREISATAMSRVGSIGVIAVHQEITKALQNDGVNVTVLRAGKYKALGNRYEKLTDEAKSRIQAEIDKIYGIFVDTVATNRGLDRDFVLEHSAEGQEFFGRDAVPVGLVDRVESFDEVVNRLENEDNSHMGSTGSTTTTTTGADMLRKKRIALSPAAQAAIAAGADPETAAAAHPVTEDLGETGTDSQTTASAGEQETLATAEEASSDSVGSEDSGSSEDSRNSDTRSNTGSSDSTILALTDKLLKVQADLASIKSEKEAVEARLASAESDQQALREIACEATERMQVALGASVTNTRDLTASAVVALYHQTKKDFEQRFKVGATAEVPVDEKDEDNVVVHPAATVRATKIHKGE